MFKCRKCGECCRNLDKSSLYSELDRGNGICKYLKGNLCSIYNDRPLLCRVDESYEKIFKNTMKKDEYYKLNYIYCYKLRKKLF